MYFLGQVAETTTFTYSKVRYLVGIPTRYVYPMCTRSTYGMVNKGCSNKFIHYYSTWFCFGQFGVSLTRESISRVDQHFDRHSLQCIVCHHLDSA